LGCLGEKKEVQAEINKNKKEERDQGIELSGLGKKP